MPEVMFAGPDGRLGATVPRPLQRHNPDHKPDHRAVRDMAGKMNETDGQAGLLDQPRDRRLAYDGGYSAAFRGDAKNSKTANNELDKNRGRFFRPSCEAPGFNLPVFLDKPELSIQSVRSEDRDGKRLTRVEYTIKHPDPKRVTERCS